tara:strand:- start:528 stop:728 length:201 start_codon:yes stop_codon:yes gene_type:complete
MKDNWSDYWQFRCNQIEKKFRNTYLIMKNKSPLFVWGGYDGIDNNVWIPQSYEEWLKYKREDYEKN